MGSKDVPAPDEAGRIGSSFVLSLSRAVLDLMRWRLGRLIWVIDASEAYDLRSPGHHPIVSMPRGFPSWHDTSSWRDDDQHSQSAISSQQSAISNQTHENTFGRRELRAIPHHDKPFPVCFYLLAVLFPDHFPMRCMLSADSDQLSPSLPATKAEDRHNVLGRRRRPRAVWQPNIF